jgi:cellobiose-specific phosphotransferase system component IIC
MIKNTRAGCSRFVALVERIEGRPYFLAIRRGLTLPLPLIMIGALALLLRYPPSAAMQRFLTVHLGPHGDAFADNLIAGTFGIGGLVALYGFADAFANLHNHRRADRYVNPAAAAIVVVSCFFTLIVRDDHETLLASFSLGQGMLGALLVASFSGILFLELCSIRRLRIPLNHLSNDPLVGDVCTIIPAGMLTILCFAVLKEVLMSAGWPDVGGTLKTLLSSPFAASSC